MRLERELKQSMREFIEQQERVKAGTHTVRKELRVKNLEALAD